MAKTATLTVRLDPSVKANAQAVFERLGLTTTQAVTLFLNQVSLSRGIPFDVHIPNDETAAAIRGGLAGRRLHKAASAEELFTELGG
jgi:DNA-damage-inducible protein J